MPIQKPILSDFNGVWLLQSRSILLAAETTALIIDTEAAVWSWAPGNIDYVRAYHAFDFALSLFDSPFNVPMNQELREDGVLIVSSTNLNFADSGYRLELSLEEKGKILRVTNPYALSPYTLPPFASVQYFKKIPTLPPTLIQSGERPNEINWNRPDLLFKYWVDNFLKSYNTTPGFGSTYFDLDKFKAIANLFLCGDGCKKGIHRQANIEWIYKTQEHPISYRPNIILGNYTELAPVIEYHGTVLFLQGEHKITRASRITISGLEGEWSIINGDWNIDPIVYATTPDYPQDRAAPCSSRRYVIIPYDSRGLPNYNPKKHGKAEVKAFHRFLDQTSSYRDFVIALLEAIFETGYQTHTRGYHIALIDTVNAPPRVPDTYEEIQNTFNLNPIDVISVRYRSRTYQQNNARFYFNPTQSYNLVDATIFQFDHNNPFNVDYKNSYYSYDITFDNYLVPESIRVPFFQLVTPNGPFQYVLAPPLDAPIGYQPLISRALVGLVKPELVGGRKVGYINYLSEIFLDPFFQILFPSFNPPENPDYSIKLLFGTIMHYITTELDVEDVIVDIRGNEGGFITLDYYAAACFGGKRIYPALATPLAGNPELHVTSQSKSPIINPNLIESTVPGSVFRGSKCRQSKVILITDLNAASGGDIFPAGFIGDKGDGDLGKNTQAYIVGSVDGRLTGAVVTLLFPPVNTPERAAITATIPFFGDVTVPPFEYEQDTSITLYLPQESKYTTYFPCSYTPDILIPHDFSIVYRDIGLLRPTIDYLANIKPNHSDRTTWRDTYMENALRIILGKPACVPPAAKYLQVKKSKNIIKAGVGPDCAKQDQVNVKIIPEFTCEKKRGIPEIKFTEPSVCNGCEFPTYTINSLCKDEKEELEIECKNITIDLASVEQARGDQVVISSSTNTNSSQGFAEINLTDLAKECCIPLSCLICKKNIPEVKF